MSYAAPITSDTQENVRYVTDKDGNAVAVLIPIELWRAIELKYEVAHLLQIDPVHRLHDAQVVAEENAPDQTRFVADEEERALDEAAAIGSGKLNPALQCNREDIYFGR